MSRSCTSSLLAVRLFLVALLLVGLNSAQAQLEDAEIRATSVALTELREQLQAQHAELDSTRFDLDALGLELAFSDAEEIITFQRDVIAFEQYPGLLRGAEGTLISGAGNALDQAVLLAVLLGDAGYELRIQQGELDPEQATQLLAQLKPRQAEAAPAAAELPFGLTEADIVELRGKVEAAAEQLRSSAAATVEFLSADLVAAGVELGSEPQSDLLAEAHDYFWVEYRLSAEDEWTAAHVAFASPPASLTSLEPLETLESNIPEELQHRFRFEVFIEQRMGPDLDARPIISAWERPIANMTGVALTFLNAPTGLKDSASDASLEDILATTEFFVPLFNNAVADGAEHFDLLGNSAPPAAAEDAAAGLFQSVGGLFGEAAGMLAGEENPDEYVTLTAQWLQFTLIAPGGHETVHRRMVFDRIGAENRAAGLVKLSGEVSERDAESALTARHTFMVAPGAYGAPYVADRLLGGSLSLLEQADGQLQSGADGPLLEQDHAAVQAFDHLQLFQAFEEADLPADTISYRHKPALVVLEEGWTQDFTRVDVISNPRRVLRVTADSLPVAAPELVLQAGVWETRIEDLPLRKRGLQSSNTFTTFEEAEQHGIPRVTLTTPDAMAQLDLPAATLAAIETDLAAGYLVITPVALPAAGAHPGWWRVDAVTGETLGRGGDGRGQATTEYLGLSGTQWGILVSATTSFTSCTVNYSDWVQYACCLVEAAALTATGVGLGNVLQAKLAWGTLETFLLMDASMGTATLVYGVGLDVMPSVCSFLPGS